MKKTHALLRACALSSCMCKLLLVQIAACANCRYPVGGDSLSVTKGVRTDVEVCVFC